MPAPRSCPACKSRMEKLTLQRTTTGELILDICWDCHAIWFDQFESTSLAPKSVIELFRLIHEHRDKPARALADAMSCPSCATRLVFTQDLQKTNRINYHRCPKGHGRLTTFFQFLREKQFVRTLSPIEVERLRATVRQVRCSGCGAPVDLGKDPACGYCRSPISILDAEAVEKALAGLSETDRRRTRPEPHEISAAFDALIATHRKPEKKSPWTRDISPMQSSAGIADLLAEGIADFLFK
ncbi:MAG: zf-TFIIB domain-containing protein [Betaproteobacteria bacterium]|nr:zf-TFIIB domain-containing protein [Betaproteobacteria bacterium]